MNFDISRIESEHKLIEIPLQVLFAESMIDTVETSFQNSPYAFYAVGMRHAVNKLLFAVVDAPVFVFWHSYVRWMFVFAKYRIDAGHVFDYISDDFPVVRNRCGFDLTIS